MLSDDRDSGKPRCTLGRPTLVVSTDVVKKEDMVTVITDGHH